MAKRTKSKKEYNRRVNDKRYRRRNKRAEKEGNKEASFFFGSFPSYSRLLAPEAFLDNAVSLENHIALVNGSILALTTHYEVCLVKKMAAGIL